MEQLKGKKVAILTDNGFEQSELTSPREALLQAGAEVHIVSKQTEVKGWNEKDWGITLKTDKSLSEASAEDYDALVVPGGVMNPDTMRADADYVAFAKHFLENGKPLASICHGPQLLIETGLLSGREMTSFPSIQTDLKNAGVNWKDEEVVTDMGLVTSRSPKDLPAFNAKMLEEIAEGVHEVVS